MCLVLFWLVCSVSWLIFSGVMAFVTLRGLLDDPRLLFDIVDDEFDSSAM